MEILWSYQLTVKFKYCQAVYTFPILSWGTYVKISEESKKKYKTVEMDNFWITKSNLVVKQVRIWMVEPNLGVFLENKFRWRASLLLNEKFTILWTCLESFLLFGITDGSVDEIDPVIKLMHDWKNTLLISFTHLK